MAPVGWLDCPGRRMLLSLLTHGFCWSVLWRAGAGRAHPDFACSTVVECKEQIAAGVISADEVTRETLERSTPTM